MKIIIITLKYLQSFEVKRISVNILHNGFAKYGKGAVKRGANERHSIHVYMN